MIAPFDIFLSHASLITRVRVLRLVIVAVSAPLLLYFSDILTTSLGLRGAFRWAALFCIVTSEMLWATVAHIGNDWLAVVASFAFCAYLVRTARKPEEANSLYCLSFALAAGLLSKAYALAFVPAFILLIAFLYWNRRLSKTKLMVASCVPLVLAGPWYGRNVLLYHEISATQESLGGVGFGDALQGVLHVSWLSSSMSLARWSLWTGNWSFLSYSKITLDSEIVALALMMLAMLLRFKAVGRQVKWLLVNTVFFLLALGYQTGVAVAFSAGSATTTEPWYVQPLLAPAMALAFLGAQHCGRIGRLLSLIQILLSAWIAFNTYVTKLIPYYGGHHGRGSIGAVYGWWRSSSKEILEGTLHLPFSVLSAVLCLFLVLLGVSTALLFRGILIDAWPEARFTMSPHSEHGN